MGKRADLRYERKFWKQGIEAVAGVDMTVRNGEIFGFLGPPNLLNKIRVS